MSAPFTVPTLAANTVARKYIWEVNTGTKAAPTWTPLGGVKSATFNSDNANLADDGRYSDGGYGRQNKTGTAWDGVLTVSRAPQDADLTQYDVAQEYLRDVAEGNLGTASEAEFRWFEWNDDDNTKGPRIQAYQGTAVVSYAEPNGGPQDNSDATFTLTGQGKLNKIDHPFPGVASVPTISSVSPTALSTAGGEIVHINGQFFTGTTGVKFAGTAASAYSVESDSLIIAVAPAHTAGSGAVVVTNATGDSTTGPNVTYA